MEKTDTTKRCPLWVKIALAMSLALNLAIIGLVAGFVLRGGPSGARLPAMGYAMPYVLALPKQMRRDVFDAVRGDDTLPDRRARRAVYGEMISALRATPYDESAVRAILARQADGASRVQAAAQSAWLEALAGMSDAERAAYTENMQEALERRGPGRKERQ